MTDLTDIGHSSPQTISLRNELNADVSRALFPYTRSITKDIFQNDSTDHVLLVTVPTTTTALFGSSSLYINYDNGFKFFYPLHWKLGTSTDSTHFIFAEGTFTISKSLHSAIPETWSEVSKFSKEDETGYIRTYFSKSKNDSVLYVTFIQQREASFVISTNLNSTQPFDSYDTIISTLTTL